MPNPFAVVATDMNRPARQSGRRAFGGGSLFAGASYDRLTADWAPWTNSPDWETRSVLRLLRARGRQLARDNGYCSGFVSAVSDNIVGPDGVMLQAKVRTLDGQFARATNKEIERAWGEWGEPETASADGFDSWTDIQRLFVETMAVDGEILLRRLKGFDNKFGFALQLIDSDLLDETYNVPASLGQNEIRMGVEMDANRRRVAYWIYSRYPSDNTGEPYKRVRIPADEIIHRFIRYRPNQVRGITWFAPVMLAMHHLGHFSLNEVVASRAASAKMGFILNKNPEAIGAWEWKKEHMRQMDVEPGVIDELMPGQEFASFDPQHPKTTYDAFELAMLRMAARGLRVSGLTLTGDLRQANYSSMRAGLLPERDHWRVLQKFVAMHCHRLVYRDWLSTALLTGAVQADSRLASDYTDVVWKGRGWSWVDPLKDLEALKLGIDLGVDSRQHANAEQGRDYEDVVDELKDEQDYAEAAGVDVSGNQIAGVSPVRVSPDGEEDETTPAGDSNAEPDEKDDQGTTSNSKDENGDPANESTGARSFHARRALRSAFRLMAGGTR